MTPIYHANTSTKKWGGSPDDYLEIHAKMDCSKSYLSDNRHRALTHHMFWINEVMVPLYGHSIINSDDREVSVKDICEKHVLEDFGHKFIPTAQDFLENIEFIPWMGNGAKGVPNSCRKLFTSSKNKNKKPMEVTHD